MLHTKSKTRNRVIVFWVVYFLAIYYLFSRNGGSLSSLNSLIWKDGSLEQPYFILDAVVYIAMGPMAAESTIDYSINSLRQLGKYIGPVYIVTDSPLCFTTLVSNDIRLHLIPVPPQNSIIHIKALKTQLFQYVPVEKKSLLYLDVDIIISKPLYAFLRDMSRAYHTYEIELSRKFSTTNVIATATATTTMNSSSSSPTGGRYVTPSHKINLGAFYDSKGHYVGYCSGCEKWHTGVLLLQRPTILSTPTATATTTTSSKYSSNSNSINNNNNNITDVIQEDQTTICLRSWETILLSGKYDTDQESLDEAERSQSCPHILPLPRNHLLFAKDYIGWFFTSGHTFIHITAVGRINEQDYFYRNIVVPKLRGSLHVTYSNKQCLYSTTSAAAATTTDTVTTVVASVTDSSKVASTTIHILS